MTRPILVPCEHCQSEGRIYHSNGGSDEIDCGKCPYCDGTGGELIDSEPATLEDADELDGFSRQRTN